MCFTSFAPHPTVFVALLTVSFGLSGRLAPLVSLAACTRFVLLAPTYLAYIVRLVGWSRGGMRDLCGWSSLASRKCQGLPREKSGVA